MRLATFSLRCASYSANGTRQVALRTRRLASCSRHRSRSCRRSSGALSSCPRTRAQRTCRRRLCGGSLFVSARGCCGLYARRTAILVGAWDATLRLVAKATDDGAMTARAAAPSGMGTTEPLHNRREVERRRGVSGAPRSVRQMLCNRRRGARADCALTRPSSMRQNALDHGGTAPPPARRRALSVLVVGLGDTCNGFPGKGSAGSLATSLLQMRVSCRFASPPRLSSPSHGSLPPRTHHAQCLRKPRCRPTPLLRPAPRQRPHHPPPPPLISSAV